MNPAVGWAMSDSFSQLEEHPEIRRCHGREALRALAAPLRDAAGLLPAPLPGMDPQYLADGLEGNEPGAMVAYRGGRPIAYMTYALQRADFPVALGSLRLARLPYRRLRLFGYCLL
jgi:hypothetical protein